MGNNRKIYTGAGAKKIAEQKKGNESKPKRDSKRVNVHGDGRPNQNRNR